MLNLRFGQKIKHTVLRAIYQGNKKYCPLFHFQKGSNTFFRLNFDVSLFLCSVFIRSFVKFVNKSQKV